jgi:hypothetical protein
MDIAATADLDARKGELGSEAEIYAHWIKFDAQTMPGEFLMAALKAKGGWPSRGSHVEPQEKKLAANGISKKSNHSTFRSGFS